MGNVLLAIWLLLFGLAFFLKIAEIQVVLALLAIVTGILLLTGR